MNWRLAGISGEYRMPSGLALAIIVSAVLHAGFLLLGNSSLSATEGDGGVHTKVVTTSLKRVDTTELGGGAVREKAPMRPVAAPLVPADQGNKSHAPNDRMSPGEALAPEISAVERVSEALPSFGVRYFKGSELTQRPRSVEPLELSYPAAGVLREDDRSGSVILRLLITETGAVDKVLVESSDLPAAFQDEAVQRFYQARFTPGKIGDAEVKSQMRIEVTFSSGA